MTEYPPLGPLGGTEGRIHIPTRSYWGPGANERHTGAGTVATHLSTPDEFDPAAVVKLAGIVGDLSASTIYGRHR